MFFFKQKTAYEMRISDWSSDVCSSDLRRGHNGDRLRAHRSTGLSVNAPACRPGCRGGQMRIAVMGAGGVGGFYGAKLAEAGHDVVLIARGRHLEAIREHGLKIGRAHV